MEYKVVLTINKQQLIDLVNGMLNDGWKLQGGISVTGAFHSTAEYFQAMYRLKTS
ncbi:MAG: DUF1737 domain-containing protein [Gammaproteobacteria bacterium]|nr:DUF1737 domain-containing protein [Gammaproteobacteria bacterium]